MIQLTIRTESAADETIDVRRFPFSVGRQASADLRSELSGVWDEHFHLDYQASDGFSLVPGGNGTTSIDSVPIRDPVKLHNGALIAAGSLKIQFCISDPEVKSYRYREFLTWGTVVVLVVLQVWLLTALPH